MKRRLTDEASAAGKVRKAGRDEPLADMVREGVLSQILDGRLRPGELISTAALARDYGTSKMPVRDALTALKRDGLMESIPYKGFVVRAIDIHDLEEVNFVRELLECAAAGLAADHITNEQLRKLRTLEEHDIEYQRRAAVGLERDRTTVTFHTVIADASRNRRLGRMIRQLLQDVYRIQYAALSVPEIEENHREHLAIIAALELHDFDASVEAMRVHLQSIERRGREALIGMRRAARIATPRRGQATGTAVSAQGLEDGRDPAAVQEEHLGA
jgi:DNA-binding GntR family transcriptional regulator